jgi:hypothetical protein
MNHPYLALLGLVLVLLSPILLAASVFYPKAEDGRYRLEEWVPLETRALKKLFRRVGWACLVIGIGMFLWNSVIFD